MVTPLGPVHFIYLGGPWRWQYERAIKTAAVHGAPIWLHSAPLPGFRDTILSFGTEVDALVTVRRIDLPEWLRKHPIKLANVKDLYAWRILHAHGGLYLDLDTISLRPVWDLLPNDRDVLVSYEHEPDYADDHPFNSAVVAGRKGADVLDWLRVAAEEILHAGVSQWGSCGPRLLTGAVEANPERFAVAPFGALNGWRDGTIHRYYAGERPAADVRVVHLFSSSNMAAFNRDRWMP